MNEAERVASLSALKLEDEDKMTRVCMHVWLMPHETDFPQVSTLFPHVFHFAYNPRTQNKQSTDCPATATMMRCMRGVATHAVEINESIVSDVVYAKVLGLMPVSSDSAAALYTMF